MPLVAFDKASRSAVDRLLAEYPAAGKLACYLIDGSHEHSDIARAVERTVFAEFFGNTPSVMAAEYGPYETHSSFLLVVDQEARASAGALRVIHSSPAGLKTLVDVSGPPLNLPTASVLECHGISLTACVDVGTLAVLRPYRGDGLVSSTLYGLLYAGLQAAGIEHVLTVLDQHAHRQLVGFLGVPFVPLCGSGPFSYLGSVHSRAVYGRVAKLRPAVDAHVASLGPGLRKLVATIARRIVYAEGLPEVVLIE